MMQVTLCDSECGGMIRSESGTGVKRRMSGSRWMVDGGWWMVGGER